MRTTPIAVLLALTLIGCDAGQSTNVDADAETTADAPESAASEVTVEPPSTRPAEAAEAAPATRPAASSDASDDDGGIPLDRLTGRWKAEGVDVPEPGSVDITLTFADDGRARVEADSTLPFVGEVKDTTTRFRLENGKIVAPGLRDGVKMPLRFEGDDVLILEYKPGKTVRFRRTMEEDDSGVVGRD